ncbi:cell division protein FtsQ/DivIB [Corynebacterium terpenotabidum]|uniref:Cell division protein n=1 Tax=Corynebacterium terpenotabidum Y-11 TaxID=1200352 RepID=S4XDF8_9CORY|nr:FtsQ-type POTRA domain-containing protein [Corynebacterium terpenotabidum]AGP30586.1 cell division protein [Corynebacterium terpenotabidum Y-11]
MPRNKGRNKDRDRNPDRTRRRPRWLLPVVAVVVVLVLGVVAAAQLLVVKTVDVSGTVNQDPAVVRETSGISDGDRMAGVDTGSAAAAVAVLPWIDTVTVSREWPSTVTVTVTEHTAIGVLDDAGTPVVVDASGEQFLRDATPEGATPMRVAATDQAAVTAAAEVLAALDAMDPTFRAQVTEVEAPAADSVTLKIGEDREVYWGTSDRAAEKAEATRVVLTREGQYWNVSNPAQPAVR